MCSVRGVGGRAALLWLGLSCASALTVVQVATGTGHTIVLMSNGSIKGFGDGYMGELGYGNTNGVDLPVNVPQVNVGGIATQVTAGTAHTCALLTNGRMKCWGSNSYFQIGTGPNIYAPGAYININDNITQIWAGGFHTCALVNGTIVHCWGMGGYGQRGTGDQLDCHCLAAVDVGANVTSLALGSYHTCGLLQNGTVKCWGNNDHGQLGNGGVDMVFSALAAPPVSLGGTAVAIVAGGAHSCALLSDGTMKCWGAGAPYGEIGSGVNVDSPSPGSAILSSVLQMSAGETHTCALLNNHSVVCFGRGDSGQLGDGEAAAMGRFAPGPPAALGKTPLVVAAGGLHTCVIVIGGTLQCFGSNAYSQLGYGVGGQKATSGGDVEIFIGPSPSPSPSVSSTISLTSTLSMSASRSGSWTGSLTPTVSASITTTQTKSSTPSASFTAGITTSNTASGSTTQTPTESPTQTSTQTSTLTSTQTSTQTPTQSASATMSISPTSTSSTTSSDTPSDTPSNSATESSTPTGSVSVSSSNSWTRTASQTSSDTPSVSGDATRSATVLSTVSASTSPSSSCHQRPSMAATSAAQSKGSTTIATASPAGPERTVVVGFKVNPATNFDYSSVHPGQHSVLISAAWPARRATVALNTVPETSPVRLAMTCDLKALYISPTHWTATFDADKSVNIWFSSWYAPGTPQEGGENIKSCEIGVLNEQARVDGRYAISLQQVETSWAEFGEVLSLKPNAKQAGWDTILSIGGGQLDVAEIWTRMCCQDGTLPCDVSACSISNASMGAPVILAAASVVRNRLQARSNATTSTASFNLVVRGQMTIALISADYMQEGADSVVGPYSFSTRVLVGGTLCNIMWVSADGHIVTVQLPDMEILCAEATAAGRDCGYQALRIEVPTMSADPWPRLGSTVECPPVCPGALLLGAHIAPVDADGEVMLRYVSATPGLDGSLIPLPVSETSSLGLYFASGCTTAGFEAVSADVCTNTSHPDFSKCSFGAGTSCSSCPEGSVCPGGFRAWPLTSYFTASESSGTIMKCPPPEDRCMGWDPKAGRTKCGVGFLDGSYMCTSCSSGYYGENDGTCTKCPPDTDVMGAARRTATFAGYALGGVVVLYALCITLIKGLGGSTHNLPNTYVNLLAWTFTTLQIVGQIGKSASPGLPVSVRTMYEALLVFQFEGASVPAACADVNPLKTQSTLCIAVLLAMTTLLCIYGASLRIPAFQTWAQRSTGVKIGLRGAVMALSLSFAPIMNGLLQVLMCSSTNIPVRSYLALQHDGSSLRSAGMTLPAQPTRADLDTLVYVSLLVADPSQVCYESYHSAAFPLALAVIAVFAILYPIAVVTYVRTRTRIITQGNNEQEHNCHFKESKCISLCCGVECAFATGSFAKRICCCWSKLDMTGWDHSSEIANLDENPAITTDVFLRPFAAGQFRPYCVWFIIVDIWLQFSLAAIGIIWRYPGSTVQNRGKALVVCIVLVVAAWMYETRRPFRAGRSWKSHVKAFSLLLCAIGAVENALLFEMPANAADEVSDTVAAWSYVLLGGTVLLVLLLSFAFVVALFAEQKLEALTAPSINLDSTLHKFLNRWRRSGDKPQAQVDVETLNQRPTLKPLATQSHKAIYKVDSADNEQFVSMVSNPMARADAMKSFQPRPRGQRQSIVSAVAPIQVRVSR